MKITTDRWWAYWDTSELERSIQVGIHPPTARFLLWNMKTGLKREGKSGYSYKIENPELEHIAPNPYLGWLKIILTLHQNQKI